MRRGDRTPSPTHLCVHAGAPRMHARRHGLLLPSSCGWTGPDPAVRAQALTEAGLDPAWRADAAAELGKTASSPSIKMGSSGWVLAACQRSRATILDSGRLVRQVWYACRSEGRWGGAAVHRTSPMNHYGFCFRQRLFTV